MNIAVVCPNFIEGKSYQENVWAEQLAKMGHTVRAFTNGDRSGDVVHVDAAAGRYELQRAKTWNLPRGTFWSADLTRLIRDFQPELIVVCGDKTWTVPLARDQNLAHVPIVATFSENRSMHEFDWRKAGITLKQRLWALGFVLTRGGPIRTLCHRSRVVVGNTPQAREILSRLFNADDWARINSKMIDRPLGFSPEHFFYDSNVRQRVRSELGLSDRDVLICASSHFAPVKEPGLKLFIHAARQAMQQHASLKALIIGFSDKPDNAATTQRITQHIEAGPCADRFLKHPFAGRERLCELFNASDIAYFARASISCQEALGTGLVGCFVNDGSLNHLVTQPQQGVFFEPGNEADLVAKLGEAAANFSMLSEVQREPFRCDLARESRWLSYDRIIQSILDEVNRRS